MQQTKLYVNLPIKDVNKSKEFFSKLGFEFDPRFSDEKALAMIINVETSAMLLKDEFFKGFVKTEIADSTRQTEVILALMFQSKSDVDSFVDKAMQLGAGKANEPYEYEFMYGRSFRDLDGHMWEVGYMDPNYNPHDPGTEK
jgi:predicted lactoylglutathione lyase